MRHRSSPPESPAADLALLLLLAAALIDGVMWASANLAAFLAGQAVPLRKPIGGLLACADPENPSRAWGQPVGSASLYWATTLLVLILLGALALIGHRVWDDSRQGLDDPHRSAGLATRAQVRDAAGPAALLSRSATLRPGLAKPTPADIGFRLGYSRGIECWASVEDSVLVVGPPRSGKGRHIVIPTILDAPGAVLTTSTRPDNLSVTYVERSQHGPALVFDPQRLAHAPGVVRHLNWSPVRGCEEPYTAILRAEAMVAKAESSGLESGTFWRNQAVAAVRCLLHAAAIDGRSAADLYRWSHAAPRAKEAVAILARSGTGAAGWDSALEAVISADPRMRDSAWAMVASTFAPLADPKVLEAVTPTNRDAFDVSSFLDECGTLYLLGTSSGASATANLIVALAEDVTETARRKASVSPGSRLDPPLSLILDEAANYPLPSLPALVSEGGGSGISTFAILQSLAQARDRWGREAAAAIWDSSIVKVVLGGSANADDLQDLSRLIGEHDVPDRSETVSPHASGKSVSTTSRRRAILEPSAIRRIDSGHALLLLRSAPPIMLTLDPWSDRPEARQLASARCEVEQAIRESNR